MVLSSSAQATNPVPYAGELQLTLWISTTTPVPSGNEILCTLSASVFDSSVAGATSYTESAIVVGTSSSATAAYCTVTIPYLWQLYSGPSDTISLTYTVQYASSTLTTNFNVLRTTVGTLPSISVPTNNTTTVISPPAVSVRL